MAVPTRNILSLCAGYGGLDLGLRLVDPAARTVCYVEREATAAGILAARFADGSLEPAPIWSDLKTFDGRAWRGTVDILTAGYPCQPFSVAGRRLGRKDPRHLWPEVARIIRESEVPEVFLENVGGHLRLGFREVAQELRRMGYRVAAGLFTAEEIGATHRRERLFILAHREGGRCGIVRQSSGRNGLANGGGEALADAERAVSGARKELHEVGRPLQTARSDNGGYAVAHTGRADNGRRPHTLEITRGRTSNRIGRTSAALAAAGSERSQIDGNGRYCETQRAAAAGTCRLFPPGPADLDAWRAVLARTPEIEPAVCGSAHGPTAGVDGLHASRTDRLRALGNGVVPLVASFAYSTLRRAFE